MLFDFHYFVRQDSLNNIKLAYVFILMVWVDNASM